MENTKSSIDNNLKYILILAGIALLALSYFLGFNKYNTKIKDIDTEITALEARYNDLSAKNNNKKEIEQKIKDNDNLLSTDLKKFSTGISFENIIVDYYQLANQLQIQIPALALTEIKNGYQFGNVQTSNPNGGVGGLESAYVGQSTTYTVQMKGTYDQMKNAITAVMSTEQRRRVPSAIGFSIDAANSTVTLNMTVNEYAITGGDRVAPQPQLPQVGVTTPNIFYSDIFSNKEAVSGQ